MSLKMTYSNKRRLVDLLSTVSKHCAYQELHPWVREVLGSRHSPNGKREFLRWEYMATHFDFTGRAMIDIGANTGYFSLAAIECGASIVHAYEGNLAHAEFIREVSLLLGISERLIVHDKYFEFDFQEVPKVDIALCLNVLHHLGDDFNTECETLYSAKQKMGRKLSQLAKIANYCWFQMGFNWKGDRNRPLFANGMKTEIIEFVQQNCDDAWNIQEVAIYDPLENVYSPICDRLLQRFDVRGEFLNRPLFLLKSSRG